MLRPLSEVLAPEHVHRIGEPDNPRAWRVTRPTLRLAARNGDLQTLNKLLDEGDLINGTDTAGRNALLWAAWSGHQDAVATLLNRGADVNGQTVNEGFSALMAACAACHSSVADTLLWEAALTRSRDASGLRAIQHAKGCLSAQRVIEEHISRRRRRNHFVVFVVSAFILVAVAALVGLCWPPATLANGNQNEDTRAARDKRPGPEEKAWVKAVNAEQRRLTHYAARAADRSRLAGPKSPISHKLVHPS